MRTRFVNLRIPAGGDATVPAEITVADGRIEAIHRLGDASRAASTRRQAATPRSAMTSRPTTAPRSPCLLRDL